MKNKIQDLNDHLFMQLERLNDETLSDKNLDSEIRRGHAMAGIAANILKAGELRVKAAQLYAEHGSHVAALLPEVGQSKAGARISQESQGNPAPRASDAIQ